MQRLRFLKQPSTTTIQKEKRICVVGGWKGILHLVSIRRQGVDFVGVSQAHIMSRTITYDMLMS